MNFASAGLSSNIGTRTTAYSLKVDRSALQQLPEAMHGALKEAIQATVLDIQAKTQEIIREKDLIDTGNLLNSITASSSIAGEGFEGTVNVGAYYGIYLEFGTRKMSAKPFLGPAVEEVGAGFVEDVSEYIRRAVKAL